jgi:hypothetical protein
VLQHVTPEISSGYVSDLVRRLRPRGLFVFQLPSTPAAAARGPLAMPESAYRSSIAVARTIPAHADAGALLTIPVTVVNLSGSMWSQDHVGAIRVGNHWLDEHAGMVLQDDGRARLPPVLSPGERCRVALEVKAPAQAGPYLLEIDVVHEGITWFADRGSRPVRVPIDVVVPETPGPGARPIDETSRRTPLPDYSDVNLTTLLPEPVDAAAIADFPMHGLPREQVTEIVTAAGGDIVHLVDDDHARPEWNGYKYFVRKR